MAGYFSYFPNFDYVSRIPDGASSDEVIPVKNIFRRPRLRDDLASVITAFHDYIIEGDERPDQVSNRIYGDSRYDWVVLLSNNITNVRDEWPLESLVFEKYCLSKYGSHEALGEVHHYETTELRDTYNRLVLPQRLQVDSDFTFNVIEFNDKKQEEVTYGVTPSSSDLTYDQQGNAKDSNGNVVRNSKVLPISNYEHEVELNDAKRRIRILDVNFLPTVIDDVKRIMKYKKSSQFINTVLKESYNPRLS